MIREMAPTSVVVVERCASWSPGDGDVMDPSHAVDYAQVKPQRLAEHVAAYWRSN